MYGLIAGTDVVVRDLVPEDEIAVAELFSACDDWFIAATGQPSGPADVQSLFYSLPEGADERSKRLLVAEDADEVVAVVDLVLHYPTSDTCAYGLFLVHPERRGRGLGTALAQHLLDKLASDGMHRATATVPAGWVAGERFLTRVGFTLDAPETRDSVGNRRAASDEPPFRRAEWRAAPR